MKLFLAICSPFVVLLDYIIAGLLFGGQVSLTDGKPDVNKIKSFIFTTELDRKYLVIGQFIAKSYSVGQELKVRE